MQRRSGDLSVTRRQWDEFLTYSKGWTNNGLTARKRRQKGRFRKKHAFDCGNTRCGGCHPDKYPRRKKTRQEKRADLFFTEQLRDFNKEQAPSQVPLVRVVRTDWAVWPWLAMDRMTAWRMSGIS
jgi:hypothetical protein